MMRAIRLGAYRLICLGGTLLAGTAPAFAAEPQLDPIDRWEVDFDTAVLWEVGGRATPLDYTFLPQMVTLKPRAVMRRAWGDGVLVVRSRFSLLAEPIVEGPESYFVGATVAPSIEWWNRARSFSAFFSIGGGVGWMDSKGHEVPGGQGQDFNLTWFLYGGVRYRMTEHFSMALGLYFQHISNSGMDDVNPGSESLGPTLGIGWHF